MSRIVSLITLPTIITAVGEYVTRNGEIVTVESIDNHSFSCSGRYSNDIDESWDKTGRLYPTTLSDNDIIEKR